MRNLFKNRCYPVKRASFLLIGFCLLTVLGFINFGYDSDLSDDHDPSHTVFGSPIFFMVTYDSINFMKFIEPLLVLPSESRHYVSNRAPPAEIRKILPEDVLSFLAILFLSAIVILISCLIFIPLSKSFRKLRWVRGNLFQCPKDSAGILSGVISRPKQGGLFNSLRINLACGKEVMPGQTFLVKRIGDDLAICRMSKYSASYNL